MRRSGKTTRLVDAAIQALFERGELHLSENHNVKTDFLDQDSTPQNRAQREFVDRLMKRLFMEHEGSFVKKRKANFIHITLIS